MLGGIGMIWRYRATVLLAAFTERIRRRRQPVPSSRLDMPAILLWLWQFARADALPRSSSVVTILASKYRSGMLGDALGI